MSQETRYEKHATGSFDLAPITASLCGCEILAPFSIIKETMVTLSYRQAIAVNKTFYMVTVDAIHCDI